MRDCPAGSTKKTVKKTPATDFESFLKQPKPKPKPKVKQPEVRSTGFDAYLKVCKPQPRPTDFNAFLKDTSVGEEAEGEEAGGQTPITGPEGHQVTLLAQQSRLPSNVCERLSRVETIYWHMHKSRRLLHHKETQYFPSLLVLLLIGHFRNCSTAHKHG